MNICNMNVIKRDDRIESVSFDKITKRISEQCFDLNINPIEVAMKVIQEIKNEITTTELDEYTCTICSSLMTNNLDYGILADRIIISNNHKNTLDTFSDKIEILYNHTDIHNIHCPLVTKTLYDYVMLNKNNIDKKIDYSKDYNFDFFAFKTLEKNYLFKVNGKIVERIQDLYMRVSLSLYLDNIESAFKSYNYMSDKYFIHATPTLFNAGTQNPQLLSCFLLNVDDSIDSIFKVNSDCAKISKNSGGIGINFDKIRCKNSYIRGNNGTSNGIIPFLKVYNETARAVNQGGKRNGSIAIYIQPHHPDIMEFLDLRKNHGDENIRARDLFTALWVSNLFMKRVQNDEMWSLFNPDDCRELSDLYGEEYEKCYLDYEINKKYIKQIKAREIWKVITISQIETGTPYILYKDHINEKSNQKNIGYISSSNLCAEIVEYSDTNEYSCCTLASIGLPRFVESNLDNEILYIYSKDGCINCDLVKMLCKKHRLKSYQIILNNKEDRKRLYRDIDKYFDEVIDSMPQVFIKHSDYEITDSYNNLEHMTYIGGFKEFKKFIKLDFNFEKLIDVTGIVVNNLNKVIDINYYPVPETETSNKKHRPLGLGVQGLADVYLKMDFAFDSEEAKELNKQIFESLYYGAVKASNELSKVEGPYSTFEGSPISEGKFQFDLWGVEPSKNLDWDKLRADVIEHGVRNSLLVALMPTASTSQILGNNECIEAYTNNIYNRRTLAGDFRVINKYLVWDLMELNLWNEDIKNLLIFNNGSVQNISVIPETIRNKYKTCWELNQRDIIQQCIDRGPFIDQTQSMNLFFEDPTANDLTKALFFGWSNGLKTGCYYIRTQSKLGAQKFTIDINEIKDIQEKYSVCEGCSG